MIGLALSRLPRPLAPAETGSAEQGGLLRVLVGLSLAMLLIPCALAPVPPLWDYPNHLARLWLLGGGASLPHVADWYRVTWDSLTNVALDAVAAQVVPWIGYMAAGRLLVAAAVLLPPIGGMVLWRTLHGGWHPWLLAFVPLAWSTTLIGGFLNFQVGIGLAMLAAAADPPLSRRFGRWWPLLRAIPGAGLIGVHPFGFVFYAGLLAGLAIGPALAEPRSIARRLAFLAASLALPCVVFLLTTPHLPGAQVGASAGSLVADVLDGWRELAAEPVRKLGLGYLAVANYSGELAGLTAGSLMATVALSGALRLRRAHAGLLIVAFGLALCFLLAPDRLGGTHWMDARFGLMVPFAAIAGLRPGLPPASGRVVTALLFGVACLDTASVAATWRARQADVVAVAEVLRHVEPGCFILPVQQRRPDLPTLPAGRIGLLGGTSFRHLAALALPWRRAFVPTLFAARGKQPIQIAEPMLALADPEGGELAQEAALRSPDPASAETPPYLRHWRDRFDYVLVVDADGPSLDPKLGEADGLTPIADSGFARLLRVVR